MGIVLIAAGICVTFFLLNLIYESQFTEAKLILVVSISFIISIFFSCFIRIKKSNKNPFLDYVIRTYLGYALFYISLLVFQNDFEEIIEGFVWLPIIFLYVGSMLLPLTVSTWYGVSMIINPFLK